MAQLSAAQRAQVMSDLQEALSKEREALGALTKAQLRTAVDDTDTWVDNNATSYNSALSEPAKTQLTSSQKARLLTFVVEKRFIEGV